MSAPIQFPRLSQSEAKLVADGMYKLVPETYGFNPGFWLQLDDTDKDLAETILR